MNDNNDKSWRKGITVSILVFLITLIYTIVRYNVLRDVPYEEIPFFLANKAIALSATILIGISLVLGSLARLFPNTFSQHISTRKAFGLIGFGLGAVHAAMSLTLLLSPGHYDKFYTDGALNTIGQFSLLFGVLAFIVFSIVAIVSLPGMYKTLGGVLWKKIQRLGYVAYFLILMHVVVMGFRGWFDPASYVFGFISISLLSALVIILVFFIRIMAIAYRGKKK